MDGEALRIIGEVVLLAFNAVTGGALIHERRKGKRAAGELGEATAATSMLTKGEAREMVEAAREIQKLVGMIGELEQRIANTEHEVRALREWRHETNQLLTWYEWVLNEHNQHVHTLRVHAGLATHPGVDVPPLRRPRARPRNRDR